MNILVATKSLACDGCSNIVKEKENYIITDHAYLLCSSCYAHRNARERHLERNSSGVEE